MAGSLTYKPTTGRRKKILSRQLFWHFMCKCTIFLFFFNLWIKMLVIKEAPMWCLCAPTAIDEKHNQLLKKSSASKNWLRCTNSMKSSRAKTSYPLCLVEKKKKKQEMARGNPTIPPDKARRAGAASPLCSDTVRVERGRKSKTEKAFLKSYRGWGSTEISNHVMATNWCRGISARADKLREAGPNSSRHVWH